MVRTVVYIGDDAGVLSQLAGHLPGEGYELQHASLSDACIEELLSSWFRVLILDADIARSPGFEFLRQVRQRDAGIPVIVLVDGHEHWLTSIAIARQNGCDAWLCQSRLEPGELAAVIGEAFRRLERWRAELDGISERACENDLRATACCDPAPLCHYTFG